MLELHKNPFFTIEERYEIAAGGAKFWKECYEQKAQQLNNVRDRLEQAEEHISMAFHPELGWAISPEEYNRLVEKYTQLYWSTNGGRKVIKY